MPHPGSWAVSSEAGSKLADVAASVVKLATQIGAPIAM